MQFASGHDLVNRWQAVSERPSDIVRHPGKADRLATLKLVLTPERSRRYFVLAAHAQARTTKPPILLRNQCRKPTLAREPMASALTEIAKLREPGRCVT